MKNSKTKTAPGAGTKKPLDRRENPGARDERGAATRAEIRSGASMMSAPRQTQRRVERSNQPRSAKN